MAPCCSSLLPGQRPVWLEVPQACLPSKVSVAAAKWHGDLLSPQLQRHSHLLGQGGTEPHLWPSLTPAIEASCRQIPGAQAAREQVCSLASYQRCYDDCYQRSTTCYCLALSKFSHRLQEVVSYPSFRQGPCSSERVGNLMHNEIHPQF